MSGMIFKHKGYKKRYPVNGNSRQENLESSKCEDSIDKNELIEATELEGVGFIDAVSRGPMIFEKDTIDADEKILLVGENIKFLNGIKSELKRLMPSTKIDMWIPPTEKTDIVNFLNSVNDEKLRMVVTDLNYKNEESNFEYGTIVVDWCNKNLIPVSEFLNPSLKGIPIELNFLKIQLTLGSISKTCKNIASIFDGFKVIHKFIENYNFEGSPDYSKILSEMLGENCKKHEISPFFRNDDNILRNLLFRFQNITNENELDFAKEKKRIFVYYTGHILLNSILRFPGPIASELSLCAILATNHTEIGKLSKYFADASYNGPFHSLEKFFWVKKVFLKLRVLEEPIPNTAYESRGEYYRSLLETELKILKKSNECTHKDCNGQGGYFCPFTKKAVCERTDCSVAQCDWMPKGAFLCRVERTFFEQWNPLLRKQ